MEISVESQIIKHWQRIYIESQLAFEPTDVALETKDLMACQCPFHAPGETGGTLIVLRGGDFRTDCCSLKGDAIGFVATVHGETRSQTVARLATVFGIKTSVTSRSAKVLKIGSEIAALPPLYRLTVGAVIKSVTLPGRLINNAIAISKLTLSTKHNIPPAVSNADNNLAVQKLTYMFVFHILASGSSALFAVFANTNLVSKIMLLIFSVVMLACAIFNGVTISTLKAQGGDQ